MDIKQVWNKFFTTWKKVITQPETFFTEWNQDEEWQEVIVFVTICGVIAGILTTILSFGAGIPTIIFYPIGLLIGTVVGGAILFVCFKIVGGAGNIEPTIKMVGYTQAVAVISWGVPLIGWIASFYQLWLLIAGGKTVHKLDTGKSAIAVLIPVVLMSLLFMLALGLGLGMLGLIMGGR